MSNFKPGIKCTVKKHYRHTDTEKVMKIIKVEPGPGYLSGIKITIDGLSLSVDSTLVVPIVRNKK